MDRTAIRRAVSGGAVIVGLGVLLLAPGRGTISLSPTSENFFSRLFNRYSVAEVNALTQLECFEASLSVIPDHALVKILAADAYADQRLSEIAYPRLRLVESGEEFGVYVDWTSQTPGTRVDKNSCTDVDIEVVSFD